MHRPSSRRVRLVPLSLCLSLLAHTALLPLPSTSAGSAGGLTPISAPRRPLTSAALRDGELLVRFREGVDEEGKSSAAAARGARRKGRLRGESGLEKLELTAGQEAAVAAEQWRALPEVEFAEPNYLVRRDQTWPDDPHFAEQWALRNEGQAGGAAGSDVRAAEAWRESTGSAMTVVAVIDSGIDFSHPDLRNNRWSNPSEEAGNGVDDDGDGLVDDSHGWDFVAGGGAPIDEQGHGTSIAGILAAEGDSGAGVSGVMWRASLMSLRVLDSAGVGDVAAAVEAIDYAASHGAQVVKCSWGIEAPSQFLRDAIERAGRRGALVVASAGNAGRDLDSQPYYPAAYDLQNLISVACSDGFDNSPRAESGGSRRLSLSLRQEPPHHSRRPSRRAFRALRPRTGEPRAIGRSLWPY